MIPSEQIQFRCVYFTNPFHLAHDGDETRFDTLDDKISGSDRIWATDNRYLSFHSYAERLMANTTCNENGHFIKISRSNKYRISHSTRVRLRSYFRILFKQKISFRNGSFPIVLIDHELDYSIGSVSQSVNTVILDSAEENSFA